VTTRHGWYLGMLIVLLVIGWRAPGLSHKAEEGERLSKIGPAPAFELTTQDGRRLFIYASCADACPLLTAKMAGLQDALGIDFGPKVFFVSITVDPEHDTPEVLTNYARAHSANLSGWAFLTGTPDEIRAVARQYGIYYRKQAGADVDHTFLTSLMDQRGTLRVQYMGIRFDAAELLHDLQLLLREGDTR
jgi:protein SCO1